jgi:hypothetical protein
MFIGIGDAFKVSALIGVLAFAGCGGDKSSPEEATGGTGASAGSAPGGAAGAAGARTGGAGGGNATGGAAPYQCSGTAAPGPSIAPGTNGTWGSASDVGGGTFPYQDVTADAVTADKTTTAGSVILTATVAASGYTGYGIYFKDPDKCWSAAAYQGIRFTISGDLGGTSMQFQVQTNNDYPIDTANSKGACPGTWSSGCGNNSYAVPAASVTAAATVIDVPWAQLTGGKPNPVESAELLGLQWQFNCTSPLDGGTTCPLNVTLGAVEFY